jgi:regulatory protein YycH of two-component signal transduction system YycFG
MQNYTTSFEVDQTPQEVFAAISNVRGWWSEEVEGDTDREGAIFYYHYQDVHRCTFKITDYVPDKKIVWHVLHNDFNFTKDKSEWNDTDIVFEITANGDKTQLNFTHVGLTPEYECYDVCSNAWGSYIASSLRNLITTGKGQPNPIQDVVDRAEQMRQQNYTTSFTVDQSPEEVFDAINNVRGWWSGEFKGPTDELGAEFEYRSGDVHYSKQKITELVPGKKIVWHVVDSQINFVADKTEWTGTDVMFEIGRKNDRTEVRFTHVGLNPAIECYDSCSDAWGVFINHGLFNSISQGLGKATIVK